MTNHLKTVRLEAVRAGLIAGLATALIGGHALAANDNSRTQCFLITQWDGWKAPNPSTIYLGVNLHDVYRVDLSTGSPQLMWPAVHLHQEVRGSNSICSALDLQLYVARDNDASPRNVGVGFGTGSGFRVPLIAKRLTKLTPEEIAAIPKKYRPN
jgi:hypothetical protein